MKLRYDLEVSGFPSSHAGHLVLLGLKEQDYPAPSASRIGRPGRARFFNGRIGRAQVNRLRAFRLGLQIADRYAPLWTKCPPSNGIGANEFIVTVTQRRRSISSRASDTPWPWELNIGITCSNVGFRTRISGETDFPCIYDDRVGLGRTYAKLDALTFDNWSNAIRAGRSYVSDGRSHLMDLRSNGVAVGGPDVKPLTGACT